MDGDWSAPARYWGFVSYSHRDAVQGRRLHGQLERYVLPRRLVGRETARGVTPRRLTPIFRDREEFPAAHDLSVEVRAALSASKVLLVICSPNAAASPWVAREVELFRALHPDRPVLAALIAGEPDAAFPAPLCVGAEPLAADFRPNRDGHRLALLKLVAGMAGVGLDELVQRDAQRHLRTVTAVTAVSVIAALTMGLLTALALSSSHEARRQKGLALEALGEARRQKTLALSARDEAQRQRTEALQARDEADRQRVAALEARGEAENQRQEAEAMVEFMSTELRGKLEGSEKLAVQSAVSQRALEYYAGRSDRLPPTSAARRARVLNALGQDFERSGDLGGALARFDEAYRVTSRLKTSEPGDPQRIFEHAQNEFGIAQIAYRRQDWAKAKGGYERYAQLADSLVWLKPDSVEYRKEAAYAQGNLCAVALKMRDTKAALERCARSLDAMREVANRVEDGRRAVASDMVNRHAWMADAYQRAGDLARARAERDQEAMILAAQLAERPKDRNVRADWIVLQQAYASLAHAAGDRAGALARLNEGRPEAVRLLAEDPDEARAKRLLDQIDRSIAYLNQLKGTQK
ncbi:TIR domain-containing protein [Caulobacter sp. RL271]|jgi:hypothetical protein|uniref:TIR domain-containing protein n=1 Tax=Caulobacter segnis TaxID=88688 RepID=A0ABY4ZXD8_9CAUL|nr:TIR domain-containing protein [Caulobacter segnis]USQ97368.1 TIR domain-containing protein [Caulobacter segnis]